VRANLTILDLTLLEQDLRHGVVFGSFDYAPPMRPVKPAVANMHPECVFHCEVEGNNRGSGSALGSATQGIDGVVRLAAQLLQLYQWRFQVPSAAVENAASDFNNLFRGFAASLMTTSSICHYSENTFRVTAN
jgi:hypothetical protein